MSLETHHIVDDPPFWRPKIECVVVALTLTAQAAGELPVGETIKRLGRVRGLPSP